MTTINELTNLALSYDLNDMRRANNLSRTDAANNLLLNVEDALSKYDGSSPGVHVGPVVYACRIALELGQNTLSLQKRVTELAETGFNDKVDRGSRIMRIPLNHSVEGSHGYTPLLTGYLEIGGAKNAR